MNNNNELVTQMGEFLVVEPVLQSDNWQETKVAPAVLQQSWSIDDALMKPWRQGPSTACRKFPLFALSSNRFEPQRESYSS